jgi:hypothetical protein
MGLYDFPSRGWPFVEGIPGVDGAVEELWRARRDASEAVEKFDQSEGDLDLAPGAVENPEDLAFFTIEGEVEKLAEFRLGARLIGFAESLWRSLQACAIPQGDDRHPPFHLISFILSGGLVPFRPRIAITPTWQCWRASSLLRQLLQRLGQRCPVGVSRSCSILGSAGETGWNLPALLPRAVQPHRRAGAIPLVRE